MKYPVYSAFVSALLVSPLFLAVGCSASAGDECSVEGDKSCSFARDEILICSRSAKDEPLLLITDMKCTDGTICEDSAEGPECVLEGGTGGSGGYGGSGGSGGSVGVAYCATYTPTPISTDCFPAPEFREDVTVAIEGSTITYTMTVGGLPTASVSDPTKYDFDVDAAGTLSGMMATGTGEFVTGTASQDPDCNAPEAKLHFDIEFDETRANYDGTINFDFTLDANCGSSICFASASVAGGPCP
jgi:hypothetical protein